MKNTENNLKQKAYRYIKEKIVNGYLVPGQDVIEAELEQEMGVSRTPIREAIMRLHNENLIEIYPRKGIFVAQITVSMVNNVHQIRQIIEPQIVRIVGQQLQKERLLEFKERFINVPTDMDKAQFCQYVVEADKDLHSYFINECNNEYLVKIMNNILDHNQRIRIQAFDINNRYLDSNKEHMQILEQLIEGQVEQAAEIMEKHIENARQVALNITNKEGENHASKTLIEALKQLEVVELSHTLEENIPVWPTHSKFMHNIWHSLDLGDGSTNYQIIMNEHNGTHIDMPSHFVKEGSGKISGESLAADCFMGPCVTLDFSNIGEDGLIDKDKILHWENQYGEICAGDIVLMNLGWAKYWHKKPNDKQFCSHWPGVAASGAQYLLEKEIKMLGVDTMAADGMISVGDPTHNLLLPNRILIVENLANLDKMTPRGYFIALPLKIMNGSASPVRAIGLIEKSS